MTKHAERFEDMSPRGRLRIWQQDDGDMIVEIVPDPGKEITYGDSVEFCAAGAGGGGSPRTLDALRDLMWAMADDNADAACARRKGEDGLSGREAGLSIAAPVLKLLQPLGAEIAADPGKHITADPLFVVFQKRRSLPLEDGYSSDYVWINHDDDYREADDKQRGTLNKMLAQGRNTGNWRKHFYVEQDEFVTACFTRTGAEAFIACNGHNLRLPHIYVTSLFRNREMIDLRNTLVAIGGGRGCSGYETPIAPAPPACICHRCIRDHDLRGADGVFPLSSSRMILCPTCGNKRCPHASDHGNACTNSNEPGQPGSIY